MTIPDHNFKLIIQEHHMRITIFFLIYFTIAMGSNPLNCSEAIARALKNNPQHQRIKFDKDIAGYQKWQSFSNRLPSLNAGYTKIRNNTEIVFPIDSTTTATIQPLIMGQESIDITWPLFTGGTLQSAQKIASKSIEISGLMVTESREYTKLETIRAYYNLIKMDGILSISEAARDLVEENAKKNLQERLRKGQLIEQSGEAAAEELQLALGLTKPLERIDCFDISHTQGAETVASMVVFRDGRMSKKDYRRYKILSAEGKPDDFKSMQEVV